MYFQKVAPKTKKRKTQKRSKTYSSSFRDPDGRVTVENGRLLRKVNISYKENFDYLLKSGLYKELVNKKQLIPHKSLKTSKSETETYKLLEPELVLFISYPYEWCFSQLKDAALLTLEINKTCLKKGMILKDASAYNTQFLNGKPVFIDTLSFKKYKEGSPWVAYQQFCRHFLNPLLLASYKDYRLMQLLRIYIDGIPLDLTSKLLPAKSYFNISVLLNIHLHAKTEKIMESKFVKRNPGYISMNSLLAIINNLENVISGLKLKINKSEWQDYYQKNSYSTRSLKDKKNIVKDFLKVAGSVKSVWDLGANTGFFSKDLATGKTQVISLDNDFLAIETSYKDVKERGFKNVLPLLIDLVNPSPGIGWMNEERESLIQRGPCDVVLALALLHHLVISNNLPFTHIANFFSSICRWLVIEFVPKEDVQVKKMLMNREDVINFYNREKFEADFSKLFYIKRKSNIKNSGRILYLMKRK